MAEMVDGRASVRELIQLISYLLSNDNNKDYFLHNTIFITIIVENKTYFVVYIGRSLNKVVSANTITATRIVLMVNN